MRRWRSRLDREYGSTWSEVWVVASLAKNGLMHTARIQWTCCALGKAISKLYLYYLEMYYLGFWGFTFFVIHTGQPVLSAHHHPTRSCFVDPPTSLPHPSPLCWLFHIQRNGLLRPTCETPRLKTIGDSVRYERSIRNTKAMRSWRINIPTSQSRRQNCCCRRPLTPLLLLLLRGAPWNNTVLRSVQSFGLVLSVSPLIVCPVADGQCDSSAWLRPWPLRGR